MSEDQLGALEARFAALIRESEPIASPELAKRSEAMFSWKKSTTYTVLKRLCDKGLFQNNKGTVTSLISREEFCACPLAFGEVGIKTRIQSVLNYKKPALLIILAAAQPAFGFHSFLGNIYKKVQRYLNISAMHNGVDAGYVLPENPARVMIRILPD